MDGAPAQAAAASTRPAFERLVLFDGVCGFCDRMVRWLIQRDPQGRLRYAPLQGPTAAALRSRHPQIPGDIDTLVYVDASRGDERVYLRSEAIFRTCAELPRPPRLSRWVAPLPRFLTDFAYALFVRSRYRLFGKLDACRIPTPEERDRFLD
jgi:predicted DCC family thiol-disulfide oxidoreductase YuxK